MNKLPSEPGTVAREDRGAGGGRRTSVLFEPELEAALDNALDLHPISIRLQKNLIDNLRALAQLHGLGYQPLIRQVLTRWVNSELKQMVVRRANEAAEERVVRSAQIRSSTAKSGSQPSAGRSAEPRQRKAA